MSWIGSWCKVSLTLLQFTTMFDQHLRQLREKLAHAGVDVAIITDDDSVYYYSGYYDYLHMEFGRPTRLMVSGDGDSLQIMASGEDIIKTHHRASSRVMGRGEPVFLCFCGMTNFHKFKLGFDRTFWIEEIGNDAQARVYRVALDSQAAALAALRPGVRAEEIHAAYAEVIQSAGYDYPFRCGRGTGFSYLEQPQLVTGDSTVLQPGMVLAVDGSVSTASFRAQVGDSFIVTEDGYEAITDHPRAIDDVIVAAH
jgi:Xaa-Pro aminopeptidase